MLEATCFTFALLECEVSRTFELSSTIEMAASRKFDKTNYGVIVMGPATHYEHSGKAPLGGILLTLIVGIVVGVALGATYGFLIYWSPFIYINLFITFGFAVGLAVAVGTAARQGKIRNSTVVTVLALLITLLAYYVHWSVWISRIMEAAILESILMPSDMWAMVSAVNMFGPWSVFGWTPAGFALWAIWGIEAIAIFGIGGLMAHTVTDVPFCEATDRWATETALARRFAPLSEMSEFTSPTSLLGALRPAEDGSAAYTAVSVATVEESDLRCVSLESVTVETDKDGKEETNKKSVVKNLLFDRHSFEKLMQLTQAQPAAV